jgi:XTP/dITP diphosphohydrolase
MMKILLASKNNGKIKEIKEILSVSELTVLSFLDFTDSPDVEETGSTFLENATIKAKAAYNFHKIPSLADDSGLSVDQLNGEPGVFSARYAGNSSNDEANNNKLISALKNHPEPHQAKFICYAVYYDGKNLLYAKGEIKGSIISEPKGSNGFGYDPLFIPTGYAITTAEMDPVEKNKISHRGAAFNNLYTLLKERIFI